MRACFVTALLIGALGIEFAAERALGWSGSPLARSMPSDLRPSAPLVHLACVMFPRIAVLADDALARRVHAGDLSALETLYRSYETVLFNLGRRLCGSDADADDILQDTFVEVSRSMDSYRGHGSLLAWMKRICVSKALMRLRRHARFPEEAFDDEDGAEPFRGRLDLEGALARLSPTTRVVVWLHDVEGYTHEEIASLLKKSVSFSKSQLSRGHARLRALLSDEGKDPVCGT